VRPGDCLVVWKLDRLGRSLSHLLHIVTTLQQHGVAFHSLTEQMDTTTPHGAFLCSGFGALAQYERALATERIRAGLAAAQRRGKRGGRPQAVRDEQTRGHHPSATGRGQQSCYWPGLRCQTDHTLRDAQAQKRQNIIVRKAVIIGQGDCPAEQLRYLRAYKAVGNISDVSPKYTRSPSPSSWAICPS
jgi:hypothetical protein